MKSIKSRFRNKVALVVLVILVAVTATLAFGSNLLRTPSGKRVASERTETSETGNRKGETNAIEGLSKVVLSVQNMSCSGCISTIKASLANTNGIKEILVDIRNGTIEVYYDDNELTDLSRVASAIASSGYPAKVERLVSATELKAERSLAAAKSRHYIASVGEWDIARADFETELEFAKSKYKEVYGTGLFSTPQGEALLGKLKSQIVTRLLDEGVVMQEINKTDYTVPAETVEDEFRAYLAKTGKDLNDFKEDLNELNYDFAYFEKKFERKVVIQTYINDRVMADASNPLEKQNAFTAWFNNSKLLASVVYYDKDLENLVRSQGSSGSCCPGN